MLYNIVIVIIILLIFIGLYFGYESFTTSDRIILYHASWCGYCKKLQPIWDQLEQYLKINKPNLKIDKILCDNNPACKLIPGYPYIVYIKNGKKYQFNKERTLENIKNFIDQPDL